jgi:RNA polymerase sigma-70 factor (ECF subfamily)
VAAAEPELAMAKARYAADLDAALRSALTTVDRRKLVLLRLHHGKGWSLDRLATVYQVSRATAGRLVVDAREALLEEIKRHLAQRLKVTESELESLVGILRSDLQVSLLRILGSDE